MMRISILIGMSICIQLIAAQDKVFDIGILYDESTPETYEIFDRLEEEIRAVLGENTQLSIDRKNQLVNHFNTDKAKENYYHLVNNKMDLIIVFGTTNSLVLLDEKNYPVPTIIAGGSYAGKVNITKEYPTTNINNLSCIVFNRSFEEDITMLHNMTGFKNAAIVVNESLNSPEIKNKYQSLANDHDFDYQFISFKDILVDHTFDYSVDAVYFSGGYYLPRQVAASLASIFLQKRIPSMISGGLEYVKMGFMATLHGEENILQYLRRLSLMTEDIVNGINPANIPGFIDNDAQLAVNFSTMTNIGVEPKYTILYNVDFVDDELKLKSEKTYTLPMLMSEALDKNLGLKSDMVDVETAQQEVKIAKANYYPEVNASTTFSLLESDKAESALGASPQYSGNANIDLNQVIFSNDLSLNKSIQESLLEAQKEYYNTEALNTVYDAVSAYFNSLILKTTLQIVRLNLQLTEKNLYIAQQNYISGQSGKADILRFQGNKAEDTKSLIDYFSQLRQSYYEINVLLNNPVYMQIDVAETDLSDDTKFGQLFEKVASIVRKENEEQAFIDFLATEAINNAPELKALAHNIEATNYSIRRYSARRYIPTIALQAGYNYDYLRGGAGSTYPTGSPAFIDNYYSGGINISMPIFSKHQQVLEKRKAEVQKDALNYDYQETRLNIQKSIACVIIDIGKQLSNIELSNIAEDAAKESFELTLDSYTNGAVPVVQLLDAQSNYIQAKLSNVNSKYNFLLALFTLERYIGRFMFMSTTEDTHAFLEEYKIFKAAQQK